MTNGLPPVDPQDLVTVTVGASARKQQALKAAMTSLTSAMDSLKQQAAPSTNDSSMMPLLMMLMMRR